jgi:carbamoyltransferase
MKKDTYVLGISGGFSIGNQDASAALIKNSEIVSAVEEERLVRVKHARGMFPKQSVQFCLSKAGITIKDVDYLAFHTDTYDNIIEDIKDYMNFHFGHCPEIKLVNHHMAHACMYLVSGFDEAKILTIDYSGDGICTTLNHGKGNKITRLKEYKTPNSLGIFYALITQFLGFKMDSDEYKVMGLSAYGKDDSKLNEKMDKILKIENNKYTLNEKVYKSTSTRQQCRYSEELIKILGKNRKSDDPVTQREMNIAKSAQKQFEKACLELLKDLSSMVKSKNLCISGGSALNCVMNSVLLQSEYVDNIYVPPVAGDSGASLGSALFVANNLGFKFGKLKTSFLGPEYSNEEIKKDLDVLKLKYEYMDEEQLLDYISNKILEGKIIGWTQGRLEYGARALGNRSILANPQDSDMKDKINKLIKFRETFRPFAPSVTLETAGNYFKDAAPSPYMTLTFDVKTDKLPAITHVDNTARVQTVSKDDNELYYKLLKKLEEKSGIAVVLNTSLNIMGQPIVCSPKDALTVYGATGMDIMVLGNYVLSKE